MNLKMSEGIVNRILSEIGHIGDTWCRTVECKFFPNHFVVKFGLTRFDDRRGEYVDIIQKVDDSTTEAALRESIDLILKAA